MANPFMDHLKTGPNRDQPNLNSGGLAKRRGGGNNRNRNKNRNRNGAGGGGGNDNTGLGPALPDINADIGLQGPNTGSIAPNPFQAHMGGGTLPVGGDAIFSDKNQYETNFANNNPQGFYNAMMANAGVNTAGTDNLGQFLNGDFYQRLQDEFTRMIADDQNQNMTWFDFLGNRAGVPYGAPGWDQAMRAMAEREYQATPLDRRGTNYGPYAGLGRWLTVG